MATLKICLLSRVHWITDVQEVILLRAFNVPDDAKNDQIAGLAFGPGFEAPPTYSMMDFDNQGTDRVGNVLSLEKKSGGSQVWVVPDGAAFLMSDSGKTIDRI